MNLMVQDNYGPTVIVTEANSLDQNFLLEHDPFPFISGEHLFIPTYPVSGSMTYQNLMVQANSEPTVIVFKDF